MLMRDDSIRNPLSREPSTPLNGQGGEPNIGSSQSWWDQNAGSSGSTPNPCTDKWTTF